MFRSIRGLLGLFVLVIAVCRFVSTAGFAQTGTTSLRGTILDNSGAVIASATVTLSNPQPGFVRTIVTDESALTSSLA